MANEHLSLKPKTIHAQAWWYETDGGIEIVHEIRTKGEYVRTETIKIPWRSIRAALARKDRPHD